MSVFIHFLDADSWSSQLPQFHFTRLEDLATRVTVVAYGDHIIDESLMPGGEECRAARVSLGTIVGHTMRPSGRIACHNALRAGALSESNRNWMTPRRLTAYK